MVGFALKGGASSDKIENVNVSEVNDHINLPFATHLEELHQAREFVGFYFEKAPSYSSISGQAIVVTEAPALDLITDPFTDFPEDVDGHDAHKGDPEEPGEEIVAGADDSDVGQPEAGVAQGEKALVVIEKSDIPNLTVFDLNTCQILCEEGLTKINE